MKHLHALSLLTNSEEPNTTEYAFKTTWDTVIDAAIVCATSGGKKIPYGSVATDDDGGLRIEWRRETDHVRLVVKASEMSKSYIYHEFAGDKNGVDRVSPENLARHLLRLYNP